jgi:hypothetical protein
MMGEVRIRTFFSPFVKEHRNMTRKEHRMISGALEIIWI